jgi:hypothetical protein
VILAVGFKETLWHINMHRDSQISQEFEKRCKGGETSNSLTRENGERGRKVQGQLTREREGEAKHGEDWSPKDSWSSPAARWSHQRARRSQRTEGRGRNERVARARARDGFFKNELWAHRIAYSACPVHTGQRTVAVR